MKAKHLISTMVEVFQAEEQTVKVAMRELRWGGLLTTGARGVNAPDLSSRDVARVTAVFLAHERPAKRGRDLIIALREVKGWRVLPDDHVPAFSLEALTGLQSPYTFEDALAALIEVYAFHRNSDAYKGARREMRDGQMQEPECIIEIMQDHEISARITMCSQGERAAIYEFQPLPPIREAMAREATPPARHSLNWIDQRSIIPIARELERTTAEAQEEAVA